MKMSQNQNIINVFLFSLFAADPGVQTKYFGHMKTDADLEKHGVRVMNSIGAMVRAILDQDDDRLVGKVHEITRNHHPRGITRPLFEFVLSVVLDYLAKALGPHLSKVPVLNRFNIRTMLENK